MSKYNAGTCNAGWIVVCTETDKVISTHGWHGELQAKEKARALNKPLPTPPSGGNHE